MRVQAALVCAIATALLGSAAVAEEFRARLGRVPVDSRTQSEVQGLGHARADLDGDRLTISGDFGGLLGPATVANLHMGIALGARGPAIHPLHIDSDRDGNLDGSVTLSAEQIAALHAGRLYIQIASEAAPDGNLWGWLIGESP